jgi:arylsulfatase A-like enzyme
MTGRYPGEVGIHSALPCSGCKAADGSIVSCGCNGFVDPVKYPTVTNVLHEAGWECGHFGKWHMGTASNTTVPPFPNAPSPGKAYGISSSETFDSNAILSVPGDPTAQLFPDAPCLLPPLHPKNKQWEALSSAAITNASLEFMDNVTAAGDGAPWYVNAWYHTAHASLDPTQDQLALVGNKTCKAALSKNSGQTTCANEIYYAAILDADTQIGRLLDGIKSRGHWSHTVIAISSDNGPEVRWSYPNSVGTTGPFRGQKRSLYDGGIRLPFVMAWPGHGPKGRVDDTSVVSAVDWFPTVLALANLTSTVDPALQATFRGHDISATFMGEGAVVQRPADKPLLWEWRYNIEGPCYMEAPQLAILDPKGEYKLLMNPPHTANISGGARIELYSRAGTGDLFEMHDLSASMPDKVEELQVPLMKFHAELQEAWPGEEFPKPGCAGEPWPPKLGGESKAPARSYPLQDP